MKVVETRDEWDDGCRESYELSVTVGAVTKNLTFCDGESEDNTLARNFNDVYQIASLLRMAYAAGKAGEELVFEEGTPEED